MVKLVQTPVQTHQEKYCYRRLSNICSMAKTKKLNPLQMVARELCEQSEMERDQIESALTGLLDHLNARAVAAIDEDENSDDAMDAAVQYRVACEVIAMFGTSLIAYEDIEDELPGGEPN